MVSAAQLKQVAGRFGAVGGQSASWQVLADGANEAMRAGGMNTVNRCAGFLSQVFEESGWLRYTQELGSGQRYAPYIGRTYIQLTWQSNYLAFGRYAVKQGWISDERYFVNNPQALAQQKWAWRGALYYFTQVNFSGYGNLVKVCDTGDIYKISKAVNAGNPDWSGTPYGMSVRSSLWNAFRSLGGSIVPSATGSSGVKGTLPGTPDQVVAKAYAELKMWGGRQYCYAWPRLKELGKSSELWCADFCWYVFWKAIGYNWHDHCSNPSYCPTINAWMARDPLWNVVRFEDAKPGDVIIFRNRSTGVYYHIGLVTKPYKDGAITTVEGDTSSPQFPGSESSAGVLAEKVRQKAYTITGSRDCVIYRGTWADTTPVDVGNDDSDPTNTTPSVPRPPEPTNLDGGITQTFDNTLTKTRDEARRLTAIRAASPSPAYLKAMRDHHAIASEVQLMLGDRQVADLTPYLVAEESQVTNDSSRAVRREASLTFRPSQGDVGNDRLWDMLSSTPGLRVAVRTGVEYPTGAVETVPVHYGMVEKVTGSLPGGKLTITSPDEAQGLIRDGFRSLYATDPRMSAADLIRVLIRTVDPKATLWDQTPAGLPVPILTLEGNYMDSVTRLAQSLGAECFASPVPHLWILRPIAALNSRAKWFASFDDVLLSMERGVDYSTAFNSMTVKTERADGTPAEATWEVTDPTSPWRVGGPFGRNHASWSSSALITAEDCTTAAKAWVDRLLGNRLSASWAQMRNPMMETGDVIQLDGSLRLVLDKYMLPLGKPTMTGEARTLRTDGVSAS